MVTKAASVEKETARVLCCLCLCPGNGHVKIRGEKRKQEKQRCGRDFFLAILMGFPN